MEGAVRQVQERNIPSWRPSLSGRRPEKLKDGWEKSLPSFPAGGKGMATRNAGNAIMNAFAKDVPELIGGAADLTASTKTILKDGGNFHVDPKGRNIWFGVREFGMCAAVNGMCGPRRPDSVRIDLLYLLRLLQVCAAHGGDHARPFAVHLHARFDCPWRRRTDSPADRASDDVACGSLPDRFSSGRRERDSGGMAAGARAEKPELHGALAAGSAGV